MLKNASASEDLRNNIVKVRFMNFNRIYLRYTDIIVDKSWKSLEGLLTTNNNHS